MYRTAISIFLQYEHARSSCVLRVILNGFGIPNTVNQVSDQYAIGGEFIIAMLRDSDIALGNESNDLLERSHQDRLPEKVEKCKSTTEP